MAKTKPRSAAAWFDSYPLPGRAAEGYTGWCRRHRAPLVAITDPAARNAAMRLADLDLTVTFAAWLRSRIAPVPVPGRHLGELIRILGPVCCHLGDTQMRQVILDATPGEPPRDTA